MQVYILYSVLLSARQKMSVQSFRKVVEIAPQQAAQFREIKELAGVCSDGCLHSSMLKRQEIWSLCSSRTKS